MNVKRHSTGQFTENFDIRDARLSLENGSCLLLDLNVNIKPRKQLPLKEMEYLRPQEDDIFHTVRIPSRPTTPQDKSFVSNDSKADASFQSNAESLEEIEVVDEEGLENMSKRELIFRVKELKKQNEDLRMTLSKTTALKVQANRIESMENLIIVLKNDMATMLNAIQRSGNHELFDEIKDKVSFFS